MVIKKNKKLDVVLRYFLPVTAGIELNVWQTYRVLAENGWDITIHTTRDTYTELDSLSENDLIDGLKIRRYEFHPFGFKPDIDWRNTDAVCLHNFDIFPHLWIMLRIFYLNLRGKKQFSLFVTPHGGFSPEGSDFPFIQRIIKRFYTYTLGVFLLNRVADGIRAVSPWEAEEMMKRGVKSSLVRIITNGLEDEAYENSDGLASEKIKKIAGGIGTYIMDNSRIKPIKNIETIIRALAMLPEHIHFIHIGTTQNPEYRKELLDLSEKLGVQSRVHLLGVVRGIDKYYLYKNASLFVHPAIWEANANVVHEAWSQKLITIVGDNTGMRAQVEDGINGFRVPAHDSKKLAQLISTVLEDKNPALSDSMRQKNMEYVNTHSWREVGQNMGEFYASMMRGKNNIYADAIINKITAEKLPCYFISPHLDDAVFSAGSLISKLAKTNNVSVVSLFTEATPEKNLSIRAFLRQCGFADALSLFTARRKEDKKVIESLGAKAVHLGFTDAPWRKENGKFIYPTHRWHIGTGKVSSRDSEMITNIKDRLLEIIDIKGENKFAVFGPLALGDHVDHVITCDVVKELFPNAILWEDVPYNIDLVAKLPSGLEAERKLEIIRGYETQFKAMFGSGPVKLPDEKFYQERIPAKKLTVSVGIPAYNEEGNIKNLLEAILRQKEINFELSEIIVASDGSTDGTAIKAKSVADKRIKVFEYSDRQGGAKRQNSLLKEFSGDILVMLDADTLPKNDYFLSGMISPFLKDPSIGILSNRGIALPAETFFERIINFSVRMKTEMFENYNQGNNIYLCHGHSRAFSRKFTEQINWPSVSGEDAYSYLRLSGGKFKFYYQPDAEILYRSPQNFSDHIKQSSRFFNSKKELERFYPAQIVRESFNLPMSAILKISAKYFFKNPFFFVSYVLIYISAYFDAKLQNRANATWEPSPSSKILMKSAGRIMQKSMSVTRPTVSIGIPAYNEEANIGHLLNNLINQKIENFVLKEIIVVSDGSTDKTAEIARSFGNPLIKVIESETKQGAAPAQNKITAAAGGDILVLLDADVLPSENNFILEIIKPILSDAEIGLVGADTVSAAPRGWFESIIAYSHDVIKKGIYLKINNAENIYLCHGRARAFRKELYESIVWPDYCAEDAYSYIFCLKSGLRFKFTNKASVMFRSPSNFKDYIKQSRRFLDGRTNKISEAEADLGYNPYAIPVYLIIRITVKNLIRNPIKTFVYIMTHIYVRTFVPESGNIRSNYDIVETSKKLV